MECWLHIKVLVVIPIVSSGISHPFKSFRSFQPDRIIIFEDISCRSVRTCIPVDITLTVCVLQNHDSLLVVIIQVPFNQFSNHKWCIRLLQVHSSNSFYFIIIAKRYKNRIFDQRQSRLSPKFFYCRNIKCKFCAFKALFPLNGQRAISQVSRIHSGEAADFTLCRICLLFWSNISFNFAKPRLCTVMIKRPLIRRGFGPCHTIRQLNLKFFI